eukprot:355305-Chlamydomonas_euryale.AAC.4
MRRQPLPVGRVAAPDTARRAAAAAPAAGDRLQDLAPAAWQHVLPAHAVPGDDAEAAARRAGVGRAFKPHAILTPPQVWGGGPMLASWA